MTTKIGTALSPNACKVFTTAGGKSYQYIPALNASKPQVDLLESLL